MYPLRSTVVLGLTPICVYVCLITLIIVTLQSIPVMSFQYTSHHPYHPYNTYHSPVNSPNTRSRTTPTIPPRKTPTTTTALNGIRGFRSWFNSTFPSAYHPIDTTNDFEEFDHVLIDMNQILHVVLRRRQDEDKVRGWRAGNDNSETKF